MTYQVSWVQAFTDNYIWIIHNDKYAIAVDVGEANLLVKFLHEHNLELVAVLITHDHKDHNGGIGDLIKYYPNVNLYGCGYASYADGVVINFPELAIECKITNSPGHTATHMIFLLDNKHLFCGDVLFSLGCGRVFTNDFVAAFNSLSKIKQYDPTTLVYPAHEYTLVNLNFTLALDKNQEYYGDYIKTIKYRHDINGNSLPVLLADELKYNLFLRTNEYQIREIIANKLNDSKILGDELCAFIGLRQLRNEF